MNLPNDRKDIQHPGSRGGKYYRAKDGRIYYGEQPIESGHEPLDRITHEHMGSGHKVGFAVGTKTYEGEVHDWGEKGAVLSLIDGSQLSVPYAHVRHVMPSKAEATPDTPKPEPEKETPWTPEDADIFDIAPEAYDAAEEGNRHAYYKRGASSSFDGLDGKQSANGKWMFTKERIKLPDQLTRNIGAGHSTVTAASAIEEYRQKYGNSDMLVFTNPEATKGTLISRSAKQARRYQLTYFDKQGFSGDVQFDSKLEAVKEAVEGGYAEPNREAFEEMSTTDDFAAGNEATRKVKLWNEQQRHIGAEKSLARNQNGKGSLQKGYLSQLLGGRV